MKKAKKQEPVNGKRHLKTMNEVSVLIAVALFKQLKHSWLGFPPPDDDYTRELFDEFISIGAKDFFECMEVYLKMESQYPPFYDFEDDLAEEVQRGEKVSDEDLGKLTPSEKEVFLLRRNERLSYKEIAKKRGKSPETVKAQLASATGKLFPKSRALNAPPSPKVG